MSGNTQPLNVFAYTPDVAGQELLSRQISKCVGGEQTLVSTIGDLVERLDYSDRPPELIVIEDESRSVNLGATSDPYRTIRSQHMEASQPRKKGPDEIAGVEILQALKDPESPYRHVPVVIYNAYYGSYYEPYGPDKILQAHAGHSDDVPALTSAVLELVDDGERVGIEPSSDPKLISPHKPARNRSPEDWRLAGDQVAEFAMNVMQSVARLDDNPSYIDELLNRVDVRRSAASFELNLLLETDQRKALAGNLARVLRGVAGEIEEKGFETHGDARGFTQDMLTDVDVDSKAVLMLLASVIEYDAFSRAYNAIQNTGMDVVMSEEKMQTFKALLKAHNIFLNSTDSVGVKDLLAAYIASDVPAPDDEFIEEINAVDEGEVAKRSAVVLQKLLDDYLNGSETFLAQDLVDKASSLTNDVHEDVVIVTTVKQCVEQAQAATIPASERLTGEQAQDIRHLLDIFIANEATGPQTKQLMFGLSEYIDEGAHYTELYKIAATLATAQGCTTSWPLHNAMLPVKQACKALHPKPADKPQPDQPGHGSDGPNGPRMNP